MPRRQGVRARTAFYNCCANICPQDADRRDGFDSRIDQCVRQGLTFCRYRTEPSQGLGPTKPARVEQVPAKRYRQPACTDAYVPTNHPRGSLPPSRVPKFARTASSECRFCLQLNAGFAGLQPALTRTCSRPSCEIQIPRRRVAPRATATRRSRKPSSRKRPCTTHNLHHRSSRHPVAAHAFSEVPGLRKVAQLRNDIVPIGLVGC